jgi:hypothetical protein
VLPLLIALALLAVTGCGREPVVLTDLTVSADAASVSLAWKASRPGFSRAKIWEAKNPAAMQISPVREVPAVDFAAAFSGLKADTEYAYQLAAADVPTLDSEPFVSPVGHISTETAIQITSVTVSVSPTSALVTWRTNRATDSAVRYGRTEELEAGKANPLQTAVQDHRVPLTGLEPGQTYWVKVVAEDAANKAPRAASSPVAFSTPARAGAEIARIMPRPKPRENTLVNLSREYLRKVRTITAAEKKKYEDELRAQDEVIELSADEKAELARPLDAADRDAFERRVDLVHRWIIHLELKGIKLEHLGNAAVTLSNRYFVAPAQAASELDRVAKQLADADRP